MLYTTLVGTPDTTKQLVFYFDNSTITFVQDSDEVDLSGSERYYPSEEKKAKLLEEFNNYLKQVEEQSPTAIVDKTTIPNELNNLDYFKTKRIEDLRLKSAEFEVNVNPDMYFISSLGFKVNGDRRTKDNLQDLISFFDYQAVEGSISYRDYENQEQKVTKEQLQKLLLEHVQNGQNLYNIKWEKEKQINAAKNMDELIAVSLYFPMGDFTSGSLVPIPEPKPIEITVNPEKIEVLDNAGNQTITVTTEATKLTARSTNMLVATVMVQDKNVVVTPLFEGKADIIISGSKEGAIDNSVTVPVVITAHPAEITLEIDPAEGSDIAVGASKDYTVKTNAQDWTVESKSPANLTVVKGDGKFTVTGKTADQNPVVEVRAGELVKQLTFHTVAKA